MHPSQIDSIDRLIKANQQTAHDLLSGKQKITGGAPDTPELRQLLASAYQEKIAELQAEKEKLFTNQTNNYVVFDDKLIDIIKKYGIGALIAGGAMTLSDNPAAAQHLVPVDHDPFTGR